MSGSQALIGPVVVLNYTLENLPLVSQKVHDGMNSNSGLFSSLSISMPQLATDIANYRSSLSGAGKLATTTTKSLKRKLATDLKHLRDDVQAVVEQQTNLADALKVAESAGMTLKKIGKIVRPELTAKYTGISSVVELDAKAVAPNASYYWQFSLDSKNWTSVPETMKHVTVISGLTPGQTYYFRFRALTRHGMRDWSQIVSLIVR
jgi:hypothetical protein